MTFYDKIKHFEEPILEMLLTEAPHTAFRPTPPEFKFLNGGFVDLGFENFENKTSVKIIYRAFSDFGVIIPGTNYKMRVGRAAMAEIVPLEPGDKEKLPTLPEDWMEYVHVTDLKTNEILYAGKKLGAHQHVTEV